MWLQYNTDKYNAFLASTVNLNTIVLYLFSPTIMGINYVISQNLSSHITYGVGARGDNISQQGRHDQ